MYDYNKKIKKIHENQNKFNFQEILKKIQNLDLIHYFSKSKISS